MVDTTALPVVPALVDFCQSLKGAYLAVFYLWPSGKIIWSLRFPFPLGPNYIFPRSRVTIDPTLKRKSAEGKINDKEWFRVMVVPVEFGF